ncbi:hypothetical protein [Nocardia sp. NPDC057668]|uniref:hypothetical protein n=1 Tax=Nocardia sp. NPDC057668 TaxID=3346202 RepID=UPI0036701007
MLIDDRDPVEVLNLFRSAVRSKTIIIPNGKITFPDECGKSDGKLETCARAAVELHVDLVAQFDWIQT